MHKENILEVRKLHKRFFSKGITVKAVTDVSFDVGPGETIGIVGESGCGKTTLGRCIVRAYEASEGEVFYRTRAGEEVDFLKVDKKKRKEIRKEIQMMVPVVFLVLPVTVLFALFPGLISIVSLAQ